MNDNIQFLFDDNNKITISAANICHVKPPYIHFHRKPDEYIFYYILGGEFNLADGTLIHHLVENDMVLLDPTREHFGLSSTECRFFYCHFSISNNNSKILLPEVATAPTSGLIVPKHINISNPQINIDIRNVCTRLVSIRNEKRDLYEKITEGLMLELLYVAASKYSQEQVAIGQKQNRANKLVPEIMYHINLHFAEDLKSSDIAAEFGYNFDYLNRQFKLATGQTIFYYVNSIRIEHAKSLISTRLYTLDDVARLSGFSDVYYFSKVFKKYTGCTPGRYLA